jgi:ABC-type methionine transport system ATPase subunit
MITIVLISHDLNEIKMLCHKFYALEENTLILKKQIPRTIRN